METKTTICNKALALIGEEPINSYDDDTSLAGRACRLYFDNTLQTMLESGIWADVITLEPLMEISPLDLQRLGFEHHKHHHDDYHLHNHEDVQEPEQMLHPHHHHHHEHHHNEHKECYYMIPTDCLKIINILPAEEYFRKHKELKPSWRKIFLPKLGKDYIMSDYPEKMVIEYVKNVDNMNTYSAKFRKALYISLAADMCMYLTKDLNKTQSMIQYAEQVRADALRDSMNEDNHEADFSLPMDVLVRG